MGSRSVKAPEPSAEERALQAEQANVLRMQRDMLMEQREQFAFLQPFLYETLGYKATFEDVVNPRLAEIDREVAGINSRLSQYSGAEGDNLPFDEYQRLNKTLTTLNQERAATPETLRRLTGLEKAPLSAEDQLREEINLKYLQREKAALAGELPVNPALMRDLAKRESTLEQQLVQDYGSISDARRSTGGQSQLTEFNAEKDIVLDAARRGDMMTASQLGMARDAANLNRQFMPTSIPGMNSGTVGGFNNLTQLYGAAQAPFANYNQLGYNAAVSRANAQNQNTGAAIGGAASLAMIAMMCSKEIKEDMEPLDYEEILSAFDEMHVESWRYIGTDRTHIGPYAEDFRAAFGIGDGRTIQVIDAVGVLMAAVKALKAKVAELERANG